MCDQRDNFIKVLVVAVLNEQGEPLNALIVAEGPDWILWQRRRRRCPIVWHKDGS
jgi:hypothetical protein